MSRGGDSEALLAVLDPDVVFRADAAAVKLGSQAKIKGAAAVANTFKGRALGAKPAFVDDGFGLIVEVGGQPRVILRLTIRDGRIVRRRRSPMRSGSARSTSRRSTKDKEHSRS